MALRLTEYKFEDLDSSLLPDGFSLLSLGGQTMFPVYGESGGPLLECIFYIVHAPSSTCLGVRVSASPSISAEYMEKAVRFGIDNFQDKCSVFRADGGDLGRGIRFEGYALQEK